LAGGVGLLAGWLLRKAAGKLGSVGWKTGSGGALLAGRGLGLTLRSGVRLATVNALVLFVITNGSMIYLLGNSEVADAEQDSLRLGGKGLSIEVPGDATKAQTDQVLRAATGSALPVVIDTEYGHGADVGDHLTRLAMSPATADRLGLEEGAIKASKVPESLSRMIGMDASFDCEVLITPQLNGLDRLGSAKDSGSRALALLGVGEWLDPYEAQAAVNRVVAPGWRVTGLASNSGVWSIAHQTRWVVFFGLIGAVTILGVTWVKAVGDGRDAVSRISVLGMMSGNRRVAWSAMAWRVGVCTLAGVGIGGLVAWQYSGMITALGAGIGPPYGLLAILAGVAIAMAAMVWLVTVRSSRQTMANWRPGGAET
jgi:hypothetical protein